MSCCTSGINSCRAGGPLCEPGEPYCNEPLASGVYYAALRGLSGDGAFQDYFPAFQDAAFSKPIYMGTPKKREVLRRVHEAQKRRTSE